MKKDPRNLQAKFAYRFMQVRFRRNAPGDGDAHFSNIVIFRLECHVFVAFPEAPGSSECRHMLDLFSVRALLPIIPSDYPSNDAAGPFIQAMIIFIQCDPLPILDVENPIPQKRRIILDHLQKQL
jgi:hypothetical protein